MIFNESPLALVVNDVRKAADTSAFAHYGLMLHTPSGDVDVLRLLNVSIKSDFVNNYCSEVKAEFAIGEGTYKFNILANIGQLEASFYRRNYNPFKSGAVMEDAIIMQRYTALVLDADGGEMVQENTNPVSRGTEDLARTRTVTVQLFLNAMEQFRMRSCGGIYRRSTVGDVIKTILMGESTQIDVVADYSPQGIDMVDPLDAKIREHILIPHGMSSYDAPGYIHKHCGGVYSAGFSYFYHNDMWYVYPTHDFTRFHEAKRQLTLAIIPEKAMPNQEFTFMQDDVSVLIIATGQVSSNSSTDMSQIQSGNGMRFTDTQALFGDSLTVAGNKVSFQKGLANNEFITSKRTNGLNNVTTSSNTITSNRLYELSRMAGKQGKIVQVVWQNSNPDLLIPGMQIKVMYMYGDLVRQAYGVLLAVDTAIQYTGTGLAAGNYSSNSGLLIQMEAEPT